MPTPNPIHIELIYPDGERLPIKSTLSEFYVGSGEGSHLVIDDADLAPVHLCISLQGNNVHIRPYSFDLEASVTSNKVHGAGTENGSLQRIANDCIWPPGKPYRFSEYTLIFTRQDQTASAGPRRYSVEQVFQGMLGPSFNFRLLRFFGVPLNTLMMSRWPILILFASGLTIGALFMRLSRINFSYWVSPRATPTLTAPAPNPSPLSVVLPTDTPLPPTTPASRLVLPTATQTAPSIADIRVGELPKGPDVRMADVATPTENPSEVEQNTPPSIVTSVASPTPEMRKLDATLEALGIQVEEAQVNSGDLYWHLNSVQWLDVEASGGRHHIFIEVLDENNSRIFGQPVIVWWPDGQTIGNTHKVPPDPYAYEFPMGAAGNSYHVKLLELPSDILHGAGLGTIEQREHNLLTSFILIYQRRQKS